ncbi:hypothetical protein BD410DRAFT_793430 [Rickenella mellea]|uniref:Uncharacterized protein n=1 Tax=Rickenella mellea TaxID=50990 RepID=A0A4Y7PTI8_9AGAM|nr:hypothetical protein BD410DRAFT_793430 [Rickenella mellea]
MLCHSRPLPLKGFALLEELSVTDLKHACLRATFLEENWNSTKQPQCVTPPRVVQVIIPGEDGDYIVRVWRITSDFILVATVLGKIVCWDIDADQVAGVHTLGERWVVFNCRADYTYKRVFCICGLYPLSEGLMKFALLQVQFPAADTDARQVTFSTLATFSLPYSQVLDLYILDPFRRLVCVLFMFPESNSIGLYILFDWDTGLNALVDTEINEAW